MLENASNSPAILHRRGELTQKIKAEAHRLGFSLVGVTTPEPPPHWSFYEAWLLDGLHGEMAYLASERAQKMRSDPRQILPECQAILVLGVPYWTSEPGQARRDSEGWLGQVAAYAWGMDYHLVLPERMQVLVSFIEKQVGHPIANRWYSDTGPLLERDLAQRAGLGWIGKNTCLINPKNGSYFLLAEILLDLELETDEPFSVDHCGTCTRCLEACPTGCILPNRSLDARRCLSYLTIELKGAIPVELRQKIGNWIFGCDICQQVCPWNLRFSPAQGDPAFAPRQAVPQPDLLAEIKLNRESFNQKFKDSPIKRTKRRGYLRNVTLALGNVAGSAKTGEISTALGRVLQEEAEPLVRAHAAWALGQMGGLLTRPYLLQALASETDEMVLIEIDLALQNDP